MSGCGSALCMVVFNKFAQPTRHRLQIPWHRYFSTPMRLIIYRVCSCITVQKIKTTAQSCLPTTSRWWWEISFVFVTTLSWLLNPTCLPLRRPLPRTPSPTNSTGNTWCTLILFCLHSNGWTFKRIRLFCRHLVIERYVISTTQLLCKTFQF